MKVAVIGANGGLGIALVKILQVNGFNVKAIVRESSIEQIKSIFPHIEAVSSNPENLVNAFQDINIVIEVVSNSMRPNGIKNFIEAAEASNVQIFVACGGAFGLFIDDENKTRLIDVVDGRENYISMNNMHMEVQNLAFQSNIPIVFQICPPYMPRDKADYTGNFVPILNKAAGVMQVGYEDVASCIVSALSNPSIYNRGMMGIAQK